MSRILRVCRVDLVERKTDIVSEIDDGGIRVSNQLGLGLRTVVLVVSNVRKRRGNETVTVRVSNDINLAVVLGNSNGRGGVTKSDTYRSHGGEERNKNSIFFHDKILLSSTRLFSAKSQL
ncbi:hypothetical protein OGATHE_003796 [Ogataea polymorpha]|uniref:Uncharacterized protein n=1 Tax=Ogataea polymorpha TaxID=460523 RepID=A0A9P8T3Q9_9ASCO|nr:hypothetical protein OGATHE_003796 [Ogataea polymorpha]